ncbi:MAG TPA: GNAT family N-acetyltransferase [Candidatus Baltobacteraceae bacterium]
MDVELFATSDRVRMKQAFVIRRAVFVAEQGIAEAEEIDEHDREESAAIHALARPFDGATAVGTARFYPCEDGAIQIGRMAVLPEARGCGVGQRLLEALLKEADKRSFAWARLNAQIPAIEFYRRAGFGETGEQFWEAGLLHQPMVRRI